MISLNVESAEVICAFKFSFDMPGAVKFFIADFGILFCINTSMV